MNTTSYQPIVETATELWTATSYLAIMGMVVLYYDCLLTINDEVWPRLLAPLDIPLTFSMGPQIRLVWPGPPSLPKVLYYIDRYLPALYLIFGNYRQYYAFPHGSMH